MTAVSGLPGRARRAALPLRLLPALLLPLGLAALPAAAQPAAPAPTLAQAVQAAWQRAAASAEAAALLRQAEAERSVARAPWPAPPALEIGQQRQHQRAGGRSRETELGIAVPLWQPGQRAARLAQADLQARAAGADAALARLQVAGVLRGLLADWGLQQAEQAAAAAHAQALDSLARDVHRRVAAGDLARADALAADAEHLAARTALLQAQDRLAALRRQWQALTGLQALPPADVAHTSTAAGPDAAPPAGNADANLAAGNADPALAASNADAALAPGRAAAARLDAHPALQAAQQQLALLRQRLAVQRGSPREAPELLLQLRHEATAGEPDSRGLGLALRFPLGGAVRNAPLEAAALGALAQAEAQASALRTRLAADLDNARSAADTAARALRDHTQRAALLRERAGLIDTSFRAGETPLPELLRARAAAAQADAALARQQALLAQAQAQLQQALGVLP